MNACRLSVIPDFTDFSNFTDFSDFTSYFWMMLTITNHTLEKLETLLKVTGYKVRYEKGNFKTGACLLQNSRVVVINKFSGLESKILAISDLAGQLEIDLSLLDDKQISFLQQIKQINQES